MKFILAFVLVLLNLNLNSYALAKYSNEDLMNMNLNSLSADFRNDKAYSTGAGRIISGQPNSLALARRAALSDARRGLLILKRELEEGRPRRPDDVSGHVPPVKILDEFESGDIYVVRVEAVLSELMRNDSHDDMHNNHAEADAEFSEYVHKNGHDDIHNNHAGANAVLSELMHDSKEVKEEHEYESEDFCSPDVSSDDYDNFI